jgi:hypothetical protein
VTRALIAALVMLGSAPASASAAPPELFVRESPWDSHEEVSDWIPLATAPVSTFVGGDEIGYRLQVAGLQSVSMTVTGVPDGVPTQPSWASPGCVNRNGAVGEIVSVGQELQYEGNGPYTVSVTVAPGRNPDCAGGETATGSFSVAAMLAPTVIGELALRRTETAGGVVPRVTAPDARGGFAGVQCTLGATVVPGAGATAQELSEDKFPRPGEWACQARAAAEGLDDANRTASYFGDWSAPVGVVVHADFARNKAEVVGSRSARKVRFAFTTEFAAEAAGGTATMTVQRVTGCRGKDKYRGPKVATARAKFTNSKVTLNVKRPGKGFYVGRLSFAGTKLIRAGQDPAPILLVGNRGRFGFATSARFPVCTLQ